MGEDWKTDDSGDMASCEASEDEDHDPDYDCIKVESPSSGNDCAEVFEIGVQRPQVKTRAQREQLEEAYQQYEAESSAEEDATPEDIMKPSRFVAAHGDLEQSCNIPLPASPNDGDGRDALDKEDLTANTALEANLAQELAQSLDDSFASLTADATDEPELDETTLELIAYLEYLRDPKASKTASERHHTVRPQKFYPVHNPLTLADVETSRPLPQPQPRPGSKGHLDDRTDAADAIEDLKVLFANLSTDITRAHHQRDHNTPLQDELLDEWLDQGIATTNALLRQGKTALASKASEMVGRVLANEKGVGRGKTAVWWRPNKGC
ncbi:hypothetical protein ABVK25_005209 [Lepraria finkii]|uniref:Uncharacterized protein n=1 Tax=Lepraria finkii TaxID=1340010 RepID=A0ABR4B9C6_9LECA